MRPEQIESAFKVVIQLPAGGEPYAVVSSRPEEYQLHRNPRGKRLLADMLRTLADDLDADAENPAPAPEYARYELIRKESTDER